MKTISDALPPEPTGRGLVEGNGRRPRAVWPFTSSTEEQVTPATALPLRTQLCSMVLNYALNIVYMPMLNKVKYCTVQGEPDDAGFPISSLTLIFPHIATPLYPPYLTSPRPNNKQGPLFYKSNNPIQYILSSLIPSPFLLPFPSLPPLLARRIILYCTAPSNPSSPHLQTPRHGAEFGYVIPDHDALQPPGFSDTREGGEVLLV